MTYDSPNVYVPGALLCLNSGFYRVERAARLGGQYRYWLTEAA